MIAARTLAARELPPVLGFIVLALIVGVLIWAKWPAHHGRDDDARD